MRFTRFLNIYLKHLTGYSFSILMIYVFPNTFFKKLSESGLHTSEVHTAAVKTVGAVGLHDNRIENNQNL